MKRITTHVVVTFDLNLARSEHFLILKITSHTIKTIAISKTGLSEINKSFEKNGRIVPEEGKKQSTENTVAELEETFD